MENVKVTLHLTPEAAEILSQYAGERSRGYFVSQMLVALRQSDDLEGERIAAALMRSKVVNLAKQARDKYVTPASPLHGK